MNPDGYEACILIGMIHNTRKGISMSRLTKAWRSKKHEPTAFGIEWFGRGEIKCRGETR